MSIVREKLSTQLKLSGECPTHVRTHVTAGRHEIVIDEPSSRGGTDRGPTPIETMIGSLIGCTNVIVNRIAEANGIKITALKVDAVAALDRRGVMLREEVRVPIPEINLFIDLTSSANDAEIARLKSDLGKFCPVSKVFRQAGTRLEEVWRVTRSE